MKEIIVAGMKRSGNHALINFLLGHLGESYVIEWKKSRKLGIHKNIKKIGRLKARDLSTEFIPFPRFGFRIISLENVHDLFEVEKISNKKATVIKRLVILRDPRNWLASIIKSRRHKVKGQIDIWKKNAQYILREDRKCFFVNFIKLIDPNPSYRKTISEYIDEEFSDAGIHYISSLGSSFDGYKYQKQALKMDLKNRWKDPVIEDKVNFYMDKEMEEYSKAIFGAIYES